MLAWHNYTLMAYNGQNDTHKTHNDDGTPRTHRNAGKPYNTVSLRGVFEMAASPSSKAKKTALALMASSYNDHDGRAGGVRW